MSDINKIRRDRLEVIRAAERALKPLDTQIELLQRFLKRLKIRRKKIPTSAEFNAVVDGGQKLDSLLDDFVKVLRAARRLFIYPR